MNKSAKKKLLIGAGIGLSVLLLTGCTQNFCSDADRASMQYPYEQGVTVYVNKAEYDSLVSDGTISAADIDSGIAGLALEGNSEIYKYVPYERNKSTGAITYTAKKAISLLQGSVIANADKNGYALPSTKFWASIDDYVLKASLVQAAYERQGFGIATAYSSSSDYDNAYQSSTAFQGFVSALTIADSETVIDESKLYINPYVEFNTDGKGATPISWSVSLLRRYGYLKFTGLDSKLYGFYESWVDEFRKSTVEGLGLDGCPTADFLAYYKNTVTSTISSKTTCIATRSGTYGHYGPASDWEVEISEKSWGYAWGKGFLEGLLVYPVSWLVDTFAYSFDSSLTGMGQIWALVLVTIIVRSVLLLLTFKTTMDQQKMQALQPQLAKIQAKYPNANTNQAEKQRMSQEQMALYKRNKINPFGQILVMIIQFPVFICVWSGLSGSAALSSGQVLNLRLSDTIRETLFNVSGTWYLNTTGWWTALILFLLMAGVQIFAMILPRIIAKVRNKKLAKMGVNPAANAQNKQMKWVTIIMLGFTIVMGFMLPAAMGVYWLIGGIISIVQTLITQLVMARNAKKRG